MSRPWRPPSSYYPRDIVNALEEGKTMKQLALGDECFPYSSRLAMHMTECGSDEFFSKRETTRLATNPDDDAEMDRGFDTVVKYWELFKPRDARGRYRKNKRSSKQFEGRVLKTIDAELAVLCIMIDITRAMGVPGSHSIAEFVTETGRSPRRILQCISTIVDNGYVQQFVGRGLRSSLHARAMYMRPDGDPAIIYNLEEKYPHSDLRRKVKRRRWRKNRLVSEKPEIA